MFQERRKFYRYPLEIQVELLTSSSTAVQVHTRDLSLQGAQLALDQPTLSSVAPRSYGTNRADNIQITLRISVRQPDRAHIQPMLLNGIVIWVRRYAQNEFHVGVEFSLPDEETRQRLKRLFEGPNEPGSNTPSNQAPPEQALRLTEAAPLALHRRQRRPAPGSSAADRQAHNRHPTLLKYPIRAPVWNPHTNGPPRWLCLN